ncbi:OPT family small oligopeptide transporter [Tirmania nivea]|nr:OPT family small oligopeptide transporter [Tirmania nivea]
MTALLRSSPAAGMSSYGALPPIPIDSEYASSLEGESVSDEEIDQGHEGEEEDRVGQEDRLYVERDQECVDGAKSRMRKRSGVMGAEMLRPSRALGEGLGEGLGIGIGPGLGPEVTEEEEQYDESDPPDNSPYAEVRATVLASDDISLSINTPRMWFLSILFSLIGSATNLFFSLRYPSISITPVIALLLAHPLGLLWDSFFHDSGNEDPNGLGVNKPLPGVGERWMKVRRWLGQGKWNRKEHCCVYISSNVSFGFAFATDVIVEQTHFYNQNPGVMYQILLTLSTQILGYTFAGLTRQWLVYPGGMIWPSTLASTAMFTTLHREENGKATKENEPANGWTITRYNFFIVVFLVSFFWYFFPGLLAPFLSYFNVITWFAPKNVVVANLFGVTSGLGMFPLTFDWAQISYTGSPLLTPFWAAMNVVMGLMVVMWIIAPIMYYKNYLFAAYMPVVSSVVFDNTGKPYDVTKILTKDFLFDEDAYKRYSRVFMPITYVLSYGLQFAALAALVTQTICWHGKDIVRQWKRSRRETRAWGTGAVDGAYAPIPDSTALPAIINPAVLEAYKQRKKSMKQTPPGLSRHRRRSLVDERALIDLMEGEDVHMRLMRRYKEAPTSWYLMTFGVMLVVGIFVVEYYPVHLPWYGLLLALGICGVFFVPIGIVMAITNQQSSLYLVCQLVCGTVFPGRPVANMVFVTYGYITSTQGLKFSSDLKLGHYMKIPPRLLFSIQIVATIISSLTQIGVLNWMFANVRGICTSEAVNGFICPIARVHFNGSILWGLVGPGKFFGKEGMYRPLLWGFLAGAAAPVAVWVMGRKSKKGSVWRMINLPVVFGSVSWIPPATGINFSSWAIVCYIFNRALRRRATAWTEKYNMILSAALDAGLAFSLLVIFFAFIYPGWMDGFKWWGTEVYKQGCDWQACPLIKVPEGEHFGPDKWQ